MPQIKSLGANMTELHMDNGNVILFNYNTPVAAQTVNGWVQTQRLYSPDTTRRIDKWLAGKKAPIVSQAAINALLS